MELMKPLRKREDRKALPYSNEQWKSFLGAKMTLPYFKFQNPAKY
jgi:hypothetical protein